MLLKTDLIRFFDVHERKLYATLPSVPKTWPWLPFTKSLGHQNFATHNQKPSSRFYVSGGRRFAFRGGQQDSVNIVDGGSGLPHRTRLLSLPRRQILRRPRGRSSGTTTDQPRVTWKGVVVVNGTYCLVLINNTSLEWSTTPSSRLPRLLLSRCVRPYWVSRLVNGNAIWWR